jgi:hypothetical protein
MPTKSQQPDPPATDAGIKDAGQRPLTPEAERALAEAAARRAATTSAPSQTTEELKGRGGLDPTRYGDWEINGLASDF